MTGSEQAPGPDAQPTGKSTGRGLRWALFASLALNLLVLGIVAGLAVTGGHKGKRGDGRAPVTFGQAAGPLIRALPEDSRREFARNMRRSTRDAGLTRSAFRESLADLVQVLEQDPFDPAALDGVLSAQRDGLTALQALAQSEMRAQMLGLSNEERLVMASEVKRFLERGARAGNGDGKAN